MTGLLPGTALFPRPVNMRVASLSFPVYGRGAQLTAQVGLASKVTLRIPTEDHFAIGANKPHVRLDGAEGCGLRTRLTQLSAVTGGSGGGSPRLSARGEGESPTPQPRHPEPALASAVLMRIPDARVAGVDRERGGAHAGGCGQRAWRGACRRGCRHEGQRRRPGAPSGRGCGMKGRGRTRRSGHTAERWKGDAPFDGRARPHGALYSQA